MSDVSGEVSDEAWAMTLHKLPRARILLEHLKAFDTTVSCDGVKGIEPPHEQCATWRRAFCYEYSKTDRPYNIVSSAGRKLPKCIAICLLSGKLCMFYSEAHSLARMLCFTTRESCAVVVKGMEDVIKRAEETDASVLVTFCLPFQAGLERTHWDIRTIRKTAKGAIKDGELAFASGDGSSRTVPCTRSLEHWTDSLVAEVSRKLASEATASCLDIFEEDYIKDCGKKMDPDAMEGMVEMLKADRRKIIDSHRAELLTLHEKHKEEMEKMLTRAQDSDQDAMLRIGKVVQASKNAEDVFKKKEMETNSHNITLRQQVLALEKSKDNLTRELNATTLRNEEEEKKAKARQKTLEAQVASLKSNIAKTTAEWAKQRKGINEDQKTHKESEKKISELTKTISELTNKRDAVVKAVEASAAEARELLSRTQVGLLERDSEVSRLKGIVKGFKVVLKMAAGRLDEAVERGAKSIVSVKAMQSTFSDMDDAMANYESRIIELQNTIKTNQRTAIDAKELEDVQKRLAESEKEMGRKEHLLSETAKRVKYLERTLKESDDELRAFKKSNDADVRIHHNGDKKSNSKSYHDASTNGKDPQAHLYTAPPPPHQQAFPQSHFNIDPNLENTISNLHSALNTITAMARASSTNVKNAELAQAKLEALASVGILPPPPPQQHIQQLYYEGQPQSQYSRYN